MMKFIKKMSLAFVMMVATVMSAKCMNRYVDPFKSAPRAAAHAVDHIKPDEVITAFIPNLEAVGGYDRYTDLIKAVLPEAQQDDDLAQVLAIQALSLFVTSVFDVVKNSDDLSQAIEAFGKLLESLEGAVEANEKLKDSLAQLQLHNGILFTALCNAAQQKVLAALKQRSDTQAAEITSQERAIAEDMETLQDLQKRMKLRAAQFNKTIETSDHRLAITTAAMQKARLAITAAQEAIGQ